MALFRQFAATCLVALLLFMASRGEATVDPARRDRDLAAAVSRAQGDAVERVMPAVVSISALGEGGEHWALGGDCQLE